MMRALTLIAALCLCTSGCDSKKTTPAEPQKVSQPEAPSTPAKAEGADKAPEEAATDAPIKGEAKPGTAPEPKKEAAPEAKKEAAAKPDKDAAPAAADTPADPPVDAWMSWEGGLDFVAVTSPDLKMPNVVFHVGRMVHTPLGSTPAGMLLYQPDPAKPPVAAGYIAGDEKVGAYFGPNIFKGTPFEKAPVTKSEIEVTFDAEKGTATATAKVGDHTFKATISDIGSSYLINRDPAQMTPFTQQGVEAKAGKVVFEVDGKPVDVIIPPVGMSGGPGAVWSATGVYAR